MFVGGRVKAGKYPLAPRSYLLKNDHGKFEDVTNETAPGLAEIGMVTAALWTDYNNDHQPDLLLAGEAMPLSLFSNENGKLVNVSQQAGLGDTHGFWNSLVAGDFDNDGDMDYVAGNQGLNGPMQASADQPITIHYADFDGNGAIESFTGYYEDGECYPVHALDVITGQLPSLKKDISPLPCICENFHERIIGYDEKGRLPNLIL